MLTLDSCIISRHAETNELETIEHNFLEKIKQANLEKNLLSEFPMASCPIDDELTPTEK